MNTDKDRSPRRPGKNAARGVWDATQRERRLEAQGARHRRGRAGRGGCRLRSDSLTRAQWERLNGPVITYNVNDDTTPAEMED